MADLLGIDRRTNKNNEDYQKLKKGIIPDGIDQMPTSVQMLWGMMPHKENGKVTGEYSTMYDRSKYRFFLNAPFEIDSSCCKVMKKTPLHNYEKQTGRTYAITAQMASESRLRTQNWLQHGCNAFDSKKPISNPMSFWTEQDVLLYIRLNNIKICSVYGEVVTEDEADGQMTIGEMLKMDETELFDLERPTLKTTGCNRTGCVFCGYGCHLEKPGEGRFERLKETHPQLYDYVMRPWDENGKQGLNYKEIIDWINEHNGKGTIIRY